MNGTPEVQATMPSKEELIRKIMFLLNVPAQRLATVLNAYSRKKCRCGAEPPVSKGATLSPNFRYTCAECSPDQSAVDAQRSEKKKQCQEKSREASARWRKTHKEGAAEYKRRYRQGISYVESRKGLMSDAAWEDKLKEFGCACSTPGCGRPLSLKTAIRSAEGTTYVPVCARCRGRKAAKERWEKEKAAAIGYEKEKKSEK